MEDYLGNELVEGWYWYSSKYEADQFHPVHISPALDMAIVDGEKMAMCYMDGFDLFRAELPSR